LNWRILNIKSIIETEIRHYFSSIHLHKFWHLTRMIFFVVLTFVSLVPHFLRLDLNTHIIDISSYPEYSPPIENIADYFLNFDNSERRRLIWYYNNALLYCKGNMYFLFQYILQLNSSYFLKKIYLFAFKYLLSLHLV